MKIKGKIDFEAVLTASAAGMIWTIGTNALSNGKGKLSQKYNEDKDLYYAAGATAIGAGLLYFMPGKKWANAAGLGLIGAGGAVAAQILSGASTSNPDGLNGIIRKITGKSKAQPDARRLINRVKAGSLAPAAMAAGRVPGFANVANCEILGLN
jgi:hypothetical protein